MWSHTKVKITPHLEDVRASDEDVSLTSSSVPASARDDEQKIGCPWGISGKHKSYYIFIKSHIALLRAK